MSFSIAPLSPFGSPSKVQMPIHFGNREPKKGFSFLPEIKNIDEKHLKTDSMAFKEARLEGGLTILRLLTLSWAGGSAFSLLEVPMGGLMALVGAGLAGIKLWNRDVKTIEERAIVRDKKAEALQSQIERAKVGTLDDMLADAKAKKQPVVLYFPHQSDNAGDALLHDVRLMVNELLTVTTGNSNPSKVRFIRYDLAQAGSPDFDIPPINLKPTNYPCLMVLDGDGNTVLQEIGILGRNGIWEAEPEDLAKDIERALEKANENEKA